MQPSPLDLARPVPQGPRAYRGRIRRLGPILGMLPPVLMGALAWWLVRENSSTVRGVGSFALAVLAAPGLLVAGVPLAGDGRVRTIAIAGSALLWLVLGVVAARRATRTPVASWRDFWREYLWLAGGVWIGVVGALVAANLILGRTLV
ncbi:MAG: hypothetical protein ACOYMR_13225 [Ilumatobacteraceae bacterium]